MRRLDEVNPSLNAIVTVAEDALDRARAAEAAVLSAELGPLHGLPITVKDTIETASIRTTGGSRLRATYVPRTDATVVARLKRAGAIVIGKTNTPEMAVPYECDNPVFGRTNNPANLSRTSGGSSGGEAAAIASYMSPAGIGSDLSGSIRVPAHFCGIAGLKPTTGAVPVDGHMPEVTGPLSLGASIGPMARTVSDLRLLFRVIASHKIELSGPAGKSRVAFYVDDRIAPVTADTARAVRDAAETLRDAGFDVREEVPPGTADGTRLWVELFSRSAAAQLQKFYRGKEDRAGPAVAAILSKTGNLSSFADRIDSAEQLARAVVERERLREHLLHWMLTTPLILAPVGSTPAFPHGSAHLDVDGTPVNIFRGFSYSQTYNVFGFPAVAIPVRRSSQDLPIGVQIIGRPFEEETVLRAAEIIERGFVLARD